MSSQQTLLLLFIQLLILLLPSPGLYKLFQKAGAPGWKAFIPFYNTWIALQLAGRPRHWVFWQLIPVAGWFVSMGIYVEFVKVFGRFRLWEHALAALLPLIYFPFIGLDPKIKFIGAAGARKHKKGKTREWIDAAVFAVVAATLIRTFIFEAYMIPTGSMEKDLLINDFLFVSKMAYGQRIPMTPLSIPFVHNTLPLTDGKSYLEWIKLPYTRWFPRPIKRGNVVVFNFPWGDTVINLPDYQSQRPYYQVCWQLGHGNTDSGRQLVLGNPDQYPLIIRPVDKEENYIKRCVAIPGDTLQIRDQVLYLNGRAQILPPESETWYIVRTKGQPLDETAMKEEYDVDIGKSEEFQATGNAGEYRMLLTWTAHEKMMHSGLAFSITPEIDQEKDVFPYSPLFDWTQDNFGPLFIPNAGATISLTPRTYALYERVIRVYEGNDFEQKDGKYYLNGRKVNSYTFSMNYYWMMGDNRHNSLDSRFWGFVPDDHIVGEASFIWMSWDKGPRWRRLFSRIR
jgi:signal peptidase I